MFWAPPDQEYRNGIITEYHVDITEVDTNTAYASYIISGSNTQIGVTTLHPYYQYNFTVAAYTVGKGPVSGGLVIRTFQDGKFNYPSVFHLLCTYLHVIESAN